MKSGLKAGLGAAAAASLPPSIARALAIPADRRAGTIADVAHIVILMQENRGFDHYFGTLRGVRGFDDRFPVPVATVSGGAGVENVWTQTDRSATDGPRMVSPFHLATRNDYALMRMEGTPHSWPDAQAAWDGGRMAHWPENKTQRAMGHYRREDIPFQFALAEAFTICDAYHCSIQTGTNTNRLFLWTGTNDPFGGHGGPAIANSHDDFPEKGGAVDSYTWTTTVERMSAAGIDWRIYQDMADNFTDNPLAGFARFRAAHRGEGDADLRDRALTTRPVEALRADALAGRLPQVSYVIAPAAASEHPGPSSPAQGAAYTAAVLDALTADPAVWARTVLLVMFDENDGFFDHVPPPSPPCVDEAGGLLGRSMVDTIGEYHLVPSRGDAKVDLPAFRGRPYGLGPRVPFYAVSPWSRGGWVNSQVFDHTSVIRFLEARFGFHEPNISPWRRAVCGDLTSAFDFSAADVSEPPRLPDTAIDAARAAALKGQPAPFAPASAAPWQETGIRRSRTLPYRLEVTDRVATQGIELAFSAVGTAAAVFHVYDRLALDQMPRRYTVQAGGTLLDEWAFGGRGAYDLWVLGPNGFHRHFVGHEADAANAPVATWRLVDNRLNLTIIADSVMATLRGMTGKEGLLVKGAHSWSLARSGGWYDLTLSSPTRSGWMRRIAGRLDDGRPTWSEPRE